MKIFMHVLHGCPLSHFYPYPEKVGAIMSYTDKSGKDGESYAEVYINGHYYKAWRGGMGGPPVVVVAMPVAWIWPRVAGCPGAPQAFGSHNECMAGRNL